MVVHGEAIRKELGEIFPEYKEKVSVQYHGDFANQNTKYCIYEGEEYNNILELRSKHDKMFIMFGMQFYNKGTDRLIKLWREKYLDNNSFLIIAGMIDSSYSELIEEAKKIRDIDNILFIDHFLEDNYLNFCLNQCDAIILPYRRASMSGVVYTAAAFEKTVLCTRSGSLEEYLEDGIDSIICEADDEGLRDGINRLMALSNIELQEMGKKLHMNILSKYSWDNIANSLYKQVYNK